MRANATLPSNPVERAALPNRLMNRVRRWRSAARTRRLLLDLDDRMLLDIGLSRSDVLFPPRAIEFEPSYARKLTPLATMIMTVLVVIGSFAMVMVAGNREAARPMQLASCALFESHCLAGPARRAWADKGGEICFYFRPCAFRTLECAIEIAPVL
jgi:uncharacterized protein YjiS (DUF1127 family)